MGLFDRLFRSRSRDDALVLFLSNFVSYYMCRDVGQNHEDAVKTMIAARYPKSQDKRDSIMSSLAGFRLQMSPTEEIDLMSAVWFIYALELGEPPTPESRLELTMLMSEAFQRVKDGYRST